jgi:2'-5' RNA ligase
MHTTEGRNDARAAHVTLRAQPDVVSQRLGEAGVLIDMRTGRMFELNVTGIRIWELVNSGRSLDEALSQLQQEFAAEPDTLSAEVARLIDELLREGLLRVEPRG